jgi:hypothetical protein
MGADASKERREINTEINNFLDTHMPVFLQSEHCIVGQGEWMDPMVFLIAFQSYLAANKISIPRYINSTNIELVKYYFHKHYRKDDIYVTGSCSNNVLVGVSIEPGKWPGTKETDNRARLESEIPKVPRPLL